MDDNSSIRTQPEPEHLATASDLLEGILLGDLDLDARLTIGAALAILCDVFPPYDPRPPVTEPVGLSVGIRQTMDSLTDAIEEAGSVQESLRAGRAARELRELLYRR